MKKVIESLLIAIMVSTVGYAIFRLIVDKAIPSLAEPTPMLFP